MLEYNVIAGFLGALLSIGSYFQRSHRSITITAALAPLAWAIYFVVLSDLTTSALCVLASLRIIIGVYVIHLSQHKRYVCTFLMCMVILIVTSLTWQNNISIIPMCASIIMTYTGYNIKYPKLRHGLLLGEVFWWLNALLLEQYISLVSCSICIGVNLLMLYRERSINQSQALTKQ